MPRQNDGYEPKQKPLPVCFHPFYDHRASLTTDYSNQADIGPAEKKKDDEKRDSPARNLLRSP